MCVTEYSSSSASHAEIIIRPLPCDLSARRTSLEIFHLLSCVLKEILETVAVVRRYLVNKPLVKWFVHRCTYI